MKKLLMLALLLFASFTLVACGPDEDELTLEEASASLQIYDTNISMIRGNFYVPLEARGGVEVSWEVSHPDNLDLDSIREPSDLNPLREQLIRVTRPEPGEDHLDVTLTATLTFGDFSDTREFEGRVMAEEESDAFDSISQLYAEANVGELVTVTGVVVARVGQGYFIWDGEHVLSVFRGGTYNLGDELEVTGNYAKWHSLYQIASPENVNVINTGVDFDIEAIEISFAELFDTDEFDYSDPHNHGLKYQLEGIVVQGDLAGSGYTNWYLQSIDNPEHFVMFTHYSRGAALDYIATYDGEYISIDVHMYARHGSDGFLFFFDEDNVDVEVLELDVEAQLDADIAALTGDDHLTADDFTLPTEGPRGTTFSDWTSSDDTIIADNGTIVDLPTDYAVVEFTGTATLEEHTKDVTITVIVVGNETISVDAALDLPDGDMVHVEGLVTGFNFDSPGFYIQDEADGTGIFVRIFDRDIHLLDEVAVGNKITIFGELDRYVSFGNNQRQISGSKLITSNDGQENELYIETEMTIEDILRGFIPWLDDMEPYQRGGETNSRIYTIEDVVITDINQYGDVIINIGEADIKMHLIFDLDNAIDLGVDAEDIAADILIESMTFITERIHFGNYRVVLVDLELGDPAFEE